MRKGFIAGTALALALAGSSGGFALAQQATTTELAQAGEISAEDQEFLTKAIQAGVAEVRISELAVEKAQDEQSGRSPSAWSRTTRHRTSGC